MFKVLEFFGGIGACTTALKRLNIDYKIVDYAEINPYSVKSYNAINGTNFEPQDITKWDKDFTDIDLIMHGSPCQDFSIIGLNKGGDKGSNTRSSLMYETVRIINKIRPKAIIWENVTNLLSDTHKHNFFNYIKTLETFGYSSFTEVINAADYGIPQNRKRVFVVSLLNNAFYIFPYKFQRKNLIDFLETKVPDEFYLTDKKLETIRNTKFKYENYKQSTFDILDGKIEDFEIMDYRFDSGLRIRKNKMCPTFMCKDKSSISGVPIILQNKKLRYLTLLEKWRLMGFNDDEFKKASKVNNNIELSKQAGNSIVVNVLVEIIRELLPLI